MIGHTPGPWQVMADSDSFFEIGRNNGGRFALVSGKDTLEGEANARLIAAAPELLAALIGLANSTDTDSFDQVIFQSTVLAARGAIAKAVQS